MTFKRILYSTSLILLMLVDTSCNKWLSLEPIDGIIKEEFWKTKEDLDAAVLGCYASLVGAPPGVSLTAADGSGRPIELSIFLWGELRADNVIPTEASTTQEQKDIKDFVNVNITPSNTLVTWGPFYRTINYCNTVLAHADEVKASDPTLSTAKLNQYKAEALTLRSLMYFYLTRTFRDIPLKLTPTAKDSDLKDIGKKPQAEVLTQIVKDLKQAEGWAPITHQTTRDSKARVTKNVVNTLLADVYLWMDDYTNCLAECNKVLAYATANPTQLRIEPPTSTWWENVFLLGSSDETIFAFSHQINNPFGPFLIGSAQRLKTVPTFLTEVFPPDDSDVSNVIPNDIRRETYFNAETGDIIKYGGSTISFNDFQVYRISDVILMKAEALALSGQGPEALQLLDGLRLSRTAEISTKQNIDPSDGKAVSLYILEERRREFAFEGKRWFDLLRFAKRNNYQDLGVLINAATSRVDGASIQSVIAKFQDTNSHYLPINQADLFADLTLEQNPFYK